MATNVYCDFCDKEVGHEDSFVVEGEDRVRALHYDCAEEIGNALTKALARGPRGQETWSRRELEERLAAVEDLARRTASVWRLWLNDAEKGAINQGTFDAMKNLLGMEEA